MKPLFLMSVICAALSLFAILAFSAMTIAPAPGVEQERALMMTVASALAVGWIGVAVWMRPRPTSSLSPPQWLRRCLFAIGILYLLTVTLLVLG